MCFLMCSHFSKILFAVYRQKADCSNVTSMLNAVAYHFLMRYKTGLVVFHNFLIHLTVKLLSESISETNPGVVTLAHNFPFLCIMAEVTIFPLERVSHS